MRNRKVFGSLMVGAGLLCGSSYAALSADMSVAPGSDWTGFYAGIGGGGNYAFSDTNASGYGIYGENYFECIDDCVEYDYIGGWLAGSVASIGSGSSDGFLGAASELIGDKDNKGPAYGFVEADQVAGFLNNLTSDDNDSGAPGLFGRGQVGFDYQLGNMFVVGLDATYSLGKIDISNDASGASGIIGGAEEFVGYAYGGSNLSTDLTLENMWTVGGRMGVLVSESTLLFASGGYASAQADLKTSFEAGQFGFIDGFEGGVEGGLSAANSDWLNGYYLGAGLETLMTENISLRLEYRYTDLGSIKASASGSDSGNVDDEGGFDRVYYYGANGVSAEAEPTIHSIAASVNWRF